METIDLQILLNGVDITSHVDLSVQAPSIISAIDEELDTITLIVQDGDSLGIKGWQELVIKDGATAIFGGYVLTIEKKPGADFTKNDYSISASDYGAYLEKVQVQDVFENQTDAQILGSIFSGSADLAGFDGSTYVVPIRTIPRVVFNRKSVREVINWLCEQSGGHWYVDENKRLHYWADVEYRANFDVTHDPTDATKQTVENVRVNGDASGVVNVVEVVGGNALGGDDTFIYTQGLLSEILNLGKKISPKVGESRIIVRRNEGGATTNLLVNPSFEVNITDGWTQYQAGSGAAWAQDAAKYNQGTKSAKITAGTAMACLHSANITVNPGEPLTVQVMSWCSVLGKASIVIYDVTGAVVLVETLSRKTSAWERLTATYINTSGAAMTLRVELRNNATDSSTITYFDAAQAEKLAYPSAYCDGSLGTGYSWSGTANNSTSARVNMPVWVTLTVKTGNIDTLGARNEVLYFDSDGKLEQETNWPTIANGIEVDGQEEIPVRAVVRNYASYAFYGKWFKAVINDSAIIDSRVARIRGSTVLAENSYETETVSYDVRVPGLKAGQTQNIHLPHRGVDGDYLIKRVTTNIGIGGQIVSSVELGAVDQSLVGLLLLLKRSSAGEFDLTNDEIMDNILDFADSTTITDSGATVVGTDGPYLWDVAKWDYAKYGSE
ncbi:MAG: hypothetical protein GYA45_11620 [Pelolinea sp.]|nr:hypothetical protein [Pelolinea sp.]